MKKILKDFYFFKQGENKYKIDSKTHIITSLDDNKEYHSLKKYLNKSNFDYKISSISPDGKYFILYFNEDGYVFLDIRDLNNIVRLDFNENNIIDKNILLKNVDVGFIFMDVIDTNGVNIPYWSYIDDSSINFISDKRYKYMIIDGVFHIEKADFKLNMFQIENSDFQYSL